MSMRRNSNSFKQLLLMAACTGCAMVMFVLAFIEEPRSSASSEWVPMNAAVEAKLEQMELSQRQQATPDDYLSSAAHSEGTDSRDSSNSPNSPNSYDAVDQVENLSTSMPASPISEQQQTSPIIVESFSESKIDLNRANTEELQALKGIGPSKAKAIIADREANGYFRSVEDLLRVKGIGKKLLAGIKESVVARP